MADEQATLFAQADELVSEREGLSSNATLLQAQLAYKEYMKDVGFSVHTVKAFNGDIRLLVRYLGGETPIHQIGTQELKLFLYWLRYERDVPCSSKSYARRVTTLKSFFGWLLSVKVINSDPAEAIVHEKVKTALPIVLSDEEIDRLLGVTEAHLNDPEKSDARPHLLATLLLETGIKKAECMRLTREDFEDSNPAQPTVLIRYTNPRLLHKERRLNVSAEVLETLDRYLDQYQPEGGVIFDCTPRNLEYVLTDVAEEAKVSGTASFESLRWTATFRDYRDGVDPDKIRQKLGLSKVTWRETTTKLEALMEKYGPEAE